MLPIPQRYYVPERLRNSYKPRLEAAGLWSASTSETDNDETRSAFQKISKPKRKDKQAKQKAKKAFEREKVHYFLLPSPPSTFSTLVRSLRKQEQSLTVIQNSLGIGRSSLGIGMCL